MATSTKKSTTTKKSSSKSGSKKNPKVVSQDAHITDFLSSVIDSTKDLVDNMIDTAGDVETGARRQLNDVADKVTPTDKDIQRLRKQARELTDQVEKLARIRKDKKK